MAPRFVCRRRRNICQVSVARRWQLASRRCLCFLRGPEGRKSLIFTLPVRLATGYGATAGTSWAILPTDRISRSEIYISLSFLRSTWLASDLQQTPMWSKLSLPGYRHMTQISSTGCRCWCHCWDKSFNVIGDHVDVWYVSSAARVSRTMHRSQNILGTRVSDTQCLVTYLNKVTYLHKVSILNNLSSRLKVCKCSFFPHACVRNGT